MAKPKDFQKSSDVIKSKLDLLGLPPQKFQALLILFAQYFSTFVHTTLFSLSVSAEYLTLGNIYFLIHTSLSRSATLQTRTVNPQPTNRNTWFSHCITRSFQKTI